MSTLTDCDTQGSIIPLLVATSRAFKYSPKGMGHGGQNMAQVKTDIFWTTLFSLRQLLAHFRNIQQEKRKNMKRLEKTEFCRLINFNSEVIVLVGWILIPSSDLSGNGQWSTSMVTSPLTLGFKFLINQDYLADSRDNSSTVVINQGRDGSKSYSFWPHTELLQYTSLVRVIISEPTKGTDTHVVCLKHCHISN